MKDFISKMTLIVTVAALLGVVSASAQERHLITIDDGDVFVDGRRVPSRELPSSLKIDEITAKFEFSGDALFELSGTVYMLENGQIVEADEMASSGGHMMVFFREPGEGNGVRFLTRPAQPAHWTPESPAYDVALVEYAKTLSDQAGQVYRLSSQMQQRNQFVANNLVQQLQEEAANTARIAQQFPQFEMQSYMTGLHQRDQELYNKLVREHELEAETIRLADEIRGANSARSAEELTGRLRTLLGEIFELKQINREREIRQLEDRLDELHQLLDERNDRRREIIESRIKDLLGDSDW